MDRIIKVDHFSREAKVAKPGPRPALIKRTWRFLRRRRVGGRDGLLLVRGRGGGGGREGGRGRGGRGAGRRRRRMEGILSDLKLNFVSFAVECHFVVEYRVDAALVRKSKKPLVNSCWLKRQSSNRVHNLPKTTHRPTHGSTVRSKCPLVNKVALSPLKKQGRTDVHAL